MIYLYGINSITDYLIYELLHKKDKIKILVDEEFQTFEIYKDIEVLTINKVKISSANKVYNCIGYKNLNKRNEVNKFFKKNKMLSTFLHNSAFVHPSSTIDLGCILMNKVFIDFETKIGCGNIFWNNSIVSHNNKIGDSNFFASGSIIGGFVNIGNFNIFGFNSSVKQHAKINDYQIVNANTLFR